MNSSKLDKLGEMLGFGCLITEEIEGVTFPSFSVSFKVCGEHIVVESYLENLEVNGEVHFTKEKMNLSFDEYDALEPQLLGRINSGQCDDLDKIEATLKQHEVWEDEQTSKSSVGA